MEPTKGVIIFGVNNSKIDYINLAILNARLINSIMKVPVTLITNEEGSTHPGIEESGVFDQVVVDTSQGPVNNRTYRDTQYHQFTTDFKNFNRPSAYELSPYDETLLIDCDYIIQSDVLNQCWGSKEEIMINSDALSLLLKPLDGDEYRLNQFGIRMFWATVVYFKKTPLVHTIFNMVSHVKDHWDFYRLVYNFPNTMYRNDYAFSIALHTIYGFLENNQLKSLPIPYILTATDKDQLYKVQNKDLLIFANDPDISYKYHLTKLNGMNVHCMNKISLLRNLEELGSMYE